jgi:cell division protein ZapA
VAEVSLQIGDRRHNVACRDGQEDDLRRFAAIVDRHYDAGNRGAGGLGGERAMLLTALLLAAELEEAENRPPEPGSASVSMLARLAERLESLADTLERAAPEA